MEKLVHDLLDFSRVDGRGTDFFTAVDCQAALLDATRNVYSLIEESGATITSSDLPVVVGDPIQITRLFQNLLVNSIKYRSDDPLQIHVSAEAREDEWLFSVKDNGIGIEPQYAEKIFGIFRSLQPRNKIAGSGMGLAICRKIVSRHDGCIWVESELGKGAVFYFTLSKKDRVA
jgi:light-regulated signal transduction histidine kinase (bacteriophytochrome)